MVLEQVLHLSSGSALAVSHTDVGLYAAPPTAYPYLAIGRAKALIQCVMDRTASHHITLPRCVPTVADHSFPQGSSSSLQHR